MQKVSLGGGNKSNDDVVDSFENNVDMAEHDDDMIKFLPEGLPEIEDQEIIVEEFEATESDEDFDQEVVVEEVEVTESDDDYDQENVIDSFENDVDMTEHDYDMIKFVPDEQQEDDDTVVVVE